MTRESVDCTGGLSTRHLSHFLGREVPDTLDLRLRALGVTAARPLRDLIYNLAYITFALAFS